MKKIYEFNFYDGNDNSSGLMLVAAINKEYAMKMVNRRRDSDDWYFWKEHSNLSYTGKSQKNALVILKIVSRGGDHGFML